MFFRTLDMGSSQLLVSNIGICVVYTSQCTNWNLLDGQDRFGGEHTLLLPAFVGVISWQGLLLCLGPNEHEGKIFTDICDAMSTNMTWGSQDSVEFAHSTSHGELVNLVFFDAIVRGHPLEDIFIAKKIFYFTFLSCRIVWFVTHDEVWVVSSGMKMGYTYTM